MNKKDIAKFIGDAEQYIADLKTLIDTRTEHFDGKSERWQEGDNGQEYSEKTDKYQNLRDMMDEAKSAAEELTEE